MRCSWQRVIPCSATTLIEGPCGLGRRQAAATQAAATQAAQSMRLPEAVVDVGWARGRRPCPTTARHALAKLPCGQNTPRYPAPTRPTASPKWWCLVLGTLRFAQPTRLRAAQPRFPKAVVDVGWARGRSPWPTTARHALAKQPCGQNAPRYPAPTRPTASPKWWCLVLGTLSFAQPTRRAGTISGRLWEPSSNSALTQEVCSGVP